MGYMQKRIEAGDLVDRNGVFGASLQRLLRQPLAAILTRRLEVPSHARALGIGGATLGGSGKTPLAIATSLYLGRELSRSPGATLRVALVGHAYRARPGGPRVVSPEDRLEVVGDEALVAARAFAESRLDAPPIVVVAENRQRAIDFAAARASFLVIDGVLQTAKTRLTGSLLVVDESAPWGNGALPPSGDLRAPREALLAASDATARMRSEGTRSIPGGHDSGAPDRRPDFSVARTITHVTSSEGRCPLTRWKGVRLGVVTYMARPDRFLRQLEAAGIVPVVAHSGRNHGSNLGPELARSTREASLDGWIATAKCACHLPAHIEGRPVLVANDDVLLPPPLCAWLAALLHRDGAAASAP